MTDQQLPEQSNTHRIVVEFSDGVYLKKLIHPEGGCQPVTTCSECYRAVGSDTEPCDCCPDPDDDGCWVEGWTGNLMLSEMLHGVVELVVEPKWNGEYCELHVLARRDELDADTDGPYACTGADYHDPNCGGTCGAG